MKTVLLYILLLLSPISLLAINTSDLTIRIISGDVFHSDHNQCILDIGPRAVYIGLEVCNVGTVPLDNLTVTLDNFTTPGFSMAGGQQATQNVDNPLLPGKCDTLYWFCSYPCEDVVTNIIFNIEDLDDGTGIYDTSEVITSTRELSANAGGFITASLLSSNDTINSITCFNVTYGLSRLVPGDDVFLQPAANPSFNANCFQLVRATVLASQDDRNGCIPLGNCPLYYSITGTCGFSPSWSVEVEYCFRVQCTQTSSFLIPYASATSGNDLKYTIAGMSVVLPMELIRFNATPSGKEVYLTWTTASETNSLFYEVQKSDNAVDFYTIKTVSAAGFSAALLNYSAIDNEPYPVTYYRLKLNNANGTSTYSSIVKAVLAEDVFKTVSVYPNPAVNSLQVVFTDGYASVDMQAYTLELMDMSGKKVLERLQEPADNTVDLSEVPSGMYVMKITGRDMVQFNKLQVNK